MALKVEVIVAFPRKATAVSVELSEGATVLDALLKAGLGCDGPVGIFGEAATLATRLREADRVEVYRPLEIDPKEARRRRARLAR